MIFSTEAENNCLSGTYRANIRRRRRTKDKSNQIFDRGYTREFFLKINR